MKRLFIIFFFLCVLFSCQDNNTSIVGIWKIEGIGNVDTTSGKDKILVYALLTMKSAGAEWEFTKDGSFKITYQNNTPDTDLTGHYYLDDNGNSVVIKANHEEDKYEIKKNSNTQIQLKSTQTGIIINLTKK